MMKSKGVMDRYIFRSALLVGTMIIIVLFFRFVPAEPLNSDQFRLRDTRTDPIFLLSPKGWVDSVLNTLTLEDRIAQMIMVAAYSNNNRKNEEEVLKLVRDNHIGGLVFFQGYPYRQGPAPHFFSSPSSPHFFFS